MTIVRRAPRTWRQFSNATPKRSHGVSGVDARNAGVGSERTISVASSPQPQSRPSIDGGARMNVFVARGTGARPRRGWPSQRAARGGRKGRKGALR
jgi:hypothetical protein